MSYVLTAIISMVFGAWLALLMRNSGNAAAEERAFKDGYRAGYDVGYEYGDKVGYESGYKVGIKWIKALKNNREPIDPNLLRVDVAPGPDSIRPEGKE